MEPSTSFFKKYYVKFRETFVDPLVYSKNSPHFDALGVSLGLVIGFLIPVGGQLACLGLLRIVLRFNIIVAGAFTLVSNPLNMIPLYYGYYLLGSLVIGKPEQTIEFDSFELIMSPIMNADYFWESLDGFLGLSQAFLIRWLIAAIILAVVFGILGYVITHRIQKQRIMATARSMDTEYHALTRKLQEHQEDK